MKQTLATIALLLCSILLFGQEQDNLDLLKADSTWLKEIIKFPLGFAPEFTYQGYEDLRFDKDWSKKDRQGFWSIVYSWHITNTEQLTAKDLEINLKLYYDGLMKVVNKRKDFQVPKTEVALLKNVSKTIEADYVGTITVYDSFWSTNVMTLNIRLKKHYCDVKNTAVVVFRISPKDFDSAVWKKLESVKLREDFCEF